MAPDPRTPELEVAPDLSTSAGCHQFSKILQQELVRRYSLRPKEIEFYFLQLVTLCFTKTHATSNLQLLKSVLFNCCKESIHR